MSTDEFINFLHLTMQVSSPIYITLILIGLVRRIFSA